MLSTELTELTELALHQSDRSDEGLTLEKSAFKLLYSGQLTLST